MPDVNATMFQEGLVKLFVVDKNPLIGAIDIEFYPVRIPYIKAIIVTFRTRSQPVYVAGYTFF